MRELLHVAALVLSLAASAYVIGLLLGVAALGAHTVLNVIT